MVINVTVNNKTYLGLHVKCPTFLSDLNQTWIQADMDFYERFVWKSPISNFMEICPVGAMLIHVDRWTCWSWYALFMPVWVAPRNIAARDGVINPLTPNDHYSGCTAPLTSKRCILYIYSTNIGTEYFKHGI